MTADQRKSKEISALWEDVGSQDGGGCSLLRTALRLLFLFSPVYREMNRWFGRARCRDVPEFRQKLAHFFDGVGVGKQVGNRIISGPISLRNRANMGTPAPAKLILDTSQLEVWEIAALLDVLLAYPGSKLKRLRAVVTSRCAAQIGITIAAFPDRRSELLERYPAYDPARSRTSTEHFDERRRNALRAGAVVLAMIQETATGSPPMLRGKPVKPTLDFLVAHYWSDVRQPGDLKDSYSSWIHSIEQREVCRRFPVAHLCAALASLAQRRAFESGPTEYNYQDLDFLREWIALAQEIDGYIRATPDLENMASKLIEIRWIEPEQVSAPPLGN